MISTKYITLVNYHFCLLNYFVISTDSTWISKMFGQGGRNKSRTKMEQLFRQDHSDVYFNNERLNETLNNRIDEMKKEMLKHNLKRLVEIKQLQKEIRDGQELVKLTARLEGDEKVAPRPHTAGESRAVVISCSLLCVWFSLCVCLFLLFVAYKDSLS